MRRLGLAGAIIVLGGAVARTSTDPGLECATTKLRAAGAATSGRLACEAKRARRGGRAPVPCIARAKAALRRAFAAAERAGGCLIVGDLATISAGAVEAFVDEVVTALAPRRTRSPCASGKLRAAGTLAAAVLEAHAAHVVTPDAAQLATELAAGGAGLATAFERAEARRRCLTSDDAGAITARVTTFVDGIRAALVPSLRNLGARTGRLVGAAVRSGPINDEPVYAETLAREFSYVSTDYELQWVQVHPDRGTYNFAPVDAICEFADRHGMAVQGTPLVWNFYLPEYLHALTGIEFEAALEEHIRAVVGHYRGRIRSWVVVNEAVGFLGGLLPTVFLDKLGPSHIPDAFRWAHAADPDALLFYNDVLADGLTPRSDYIYTMLRGFLQEGVPIHGVGLEMHLGGGFGPPPATIRQNIERFASLGLLVHVSEMDVQIGALPGTLAERLEAQRGIYEGVVRDCLAIQGCHALTFWGFTDKYTWIDEVFGPDHRPLLFDPLYAPKPAYFGVRNALAGR